MTRNQPPRRPVANDKSQGLPLPKTPRTVALARLLLRISRDDVQGKAA